MRTVAVLLAAGRSERFGTDKLWADLHGAPLWLMGFRSLLNNKQVEGVGIVCAADKTAQFRDAAPEALFVVAGGDTRTESARSGFEALPDWAECALFHDAARPFVSQSVIDAVIAGVGSKGAAFPAIPVTDTIKEQSDATFRTLDRTRLVSVQTPQGALVSHFRKAFEARTEATDDMALLEALGIEQVAVQGDTENRKVTTEADLRSLTAIETRAGHGYDVHRFSDDPKRKLWLGGVEFDGPGLEGHSDADAVLHAVVDALLGAAALGDIGDHFPNTDDRWKGEPSGTFLLESARMLAIRGWDVVNIDISVIAERPRLSGKRDEIRTVVAGLAGITPDRVSVKATTNEGLGSIGRGEGVAAFAVATIKRRV